MFIFSEQRNRELGSISAASYRDGDQLEDHLNLIDLQEEITDKFRRWLRRIND